MATDLFYIEKGKGFPLILLHGNGEDHTYFQKQIQYFSAFFRVIAVDTRGHGRSPRGAGSFTLCRFADDLHTLTEELDISAFHLLGFSDGGNIALHYALKHGEKLRKLILNGANLYPSGMKSGVQTLIFLQYAALCLLAPFSQSARRQKEVQGLMVHEPHFRPEQLKALEIPVLVLVGDRDMIKSSHSYLISSSLPNGQLITLKGSHFIARDCPDVYNETVINFLKGNS